MSSYQTQRFWSPWGELRHFQEEFNRLLSATGSSVAASDTPPVNVWAGEEGAIVVAQLPGVAADSLDISILGETLTLRGKRTQESLGENASYHRRERPERGFARTVSLPFRVDEHKVVATFKHGVLQLMLPRAAVDKPKRISVKAA